ncbi:MAG TPA: CmcI family methyltransferase [Thermoleophilaceae bacterium]|nr:CmcI family methyltransferase [Thermoleophilaceae bacterium]
MGHEGSTPAVTEQPRLTIDPAAETVTVEEGGATRTHAFDSPEAFRLVSDAWVRLGWDQKYVYSFTWLGRPVIQLPEDLLRLQEVIATVRPEVIVETGVAHGGSLVFYATLCRALDRGRVIGIDVEIRPHNRAGIEAHPLFPLIELIEADSTSPETLARVRESVGASEGTLVILDSNHSKEHVLAELRGYADLVTPGSYLVVQDGIMGRLAGAPRSEPDWSWNNPVAAIAEFLAEDSRFIAESPSFAFNEGLVTDRVTYWPSGYLKRTG